MDKRITWLHFSDLHVFVQQAGNVAVMEAYKKLAETIRPDFIVVTGDFRHLGRQTTFADGIEQLEKLLGIFGVKKQDIFFVPGNHDVGSGHNPDNRKKCIADIQKGINKDYQCYTECQETLMDAFSEYRTVVEYFFKDVFEGSDPRIEGCDNVYYVCWNNMLNIVGMNTALISDGKNDHKEIFDVNALYNVMDNPSFRQALPTILLGHHSPNDIYSSQSTYLRTFLHRTNASAYLHGDVHKLMIQDAIGSILVPEKIPCISCGKSVPEAGDHYSDVSFIRYEWVNDTVTVHPYVYGEIGGILQFKESDVYNTENGNLCFSMYRSSKQNFVTPSMGKHMGAIVPFVSEDECIGRNKDIGSLMKLLQQPNAKIWIHSDGGIGKSTIARRLYHIMSDEFDRRFFINFDSSLENSLVQAVSSLFYDPHKAIPESIDRDERYKIIIDQLRNCGGKNLIIIDNVPPDSCVTADLYSFTGIPATILITARTDSIAGYVEYHLEPLDDESQKQVFRFHLGSTNITDDSAILQLLEHCYGNTLLIELTAKAAKRTGYQKLLESLESGGFQNERTPISSIDGIRGSIPEHLRQLYRLSELGSESQRILRCFALMPLVPVDVNIAKWVGADTRLLFDLSDMAWLKNQDGLFEMHPLIREIILLDKESFPVETEAGFHAYLRNNHDDFFDISLDYQFLAQRIAIATRFLHRIIDTVDYAEACNSLAVVLQEQCMYQYAEPLLLISQSIKEAKLGMSDPLTASAYHNLAMLYQGWNRPGDMDKAEKLHLKNLRIKKRKLDRNHPDTATSYNNLALLYQKRGRPGDWRKAETLYKKALNIRESVLGCDHLAVANTYNNLAYLYKCRNKKGDWDKAEKYYLEAIKILDAILNGEHTETPLTYNNLATLYMERKRDNDLEKAEIFFLKAISISEKKLGKMHPTTAVLYCNLSSLYRERNVSGDWDNAEVLLYSAVDILETVLGKRHSDTATAYVNVAALYMDHDSGADLDKAEEYLLKAKSVYENVFGVHHANTFKVYQRLMVLYAQRKQPGDRDRSMEYYYKSNTR